jgi:hypothetical protein
VLEVEPALAADVAGGEDAEPAGPGGRGIVAPPHAEEEVVAWAVDVGGGADAVDVVAPGFERVDHGERDVRSERRARRIERGGHGVASTS